MQDYDDYIEAQRAHHEGMEAELAHAFDTFHEGIQGALFKECIQALQSGAFMAQTLTVADSMHGGKTFKEADSPAVEVFIDTVLMDGGLLKMMSALLATNAASHLRFEIAKKYADLYAYPVARARAA